MRNFNIHQLRDIGFLVNSGFRSTNLAWFVHSYSNDMGHGHSFLWGHIRVIRDPDKRASSIGSIRGVLTRGIRPLEHQPRSTERSVGTCKPPKLVTKASRREQYWDSTSCNQLYQIHQGCCTKQFPKLLLQCFMFSIGDASHPVSLKTKAGGTGRHKSVDPRTSRARVRFACPTP